MDQNTKEWLEWRQKGIGSSDAAVIAGVDPHKTLLQLWKEKVYGETKEETNQFILKKGHRLETRARALLEEKLNKNFPPKLVEHEKFPHLRASLDGFDGSQVVEFKYVGKEDFKTDEIPEHHKYQMAHQRIVSGVTKILYVKYNDQENNIKVLDYEPDNKFCRELFYKEQEFWDMVLKREKPPESDKDFKEFKSKTLLILFQKFQKADEQAKKFSLLAKEAKEQLDSKIKVQRAICGPFKFQKITREGSIDYKEAFSAISEEMKQYDPQTNPEDFRRDGSTSILISMERKTAKGPKNRKA